MKVKFKSDKSNEISWSSQFNTHGFGEVIVNGDWGQDSVYIKDLDVLINGKWKDMGAAFRDKDLIHDNYNIYFFEPKNEIDRKRGFEL